MLKLLLRFTGGSGHFLGDQVLLSKNVRSPVPSPDAGEDRWTEAGVLSAALHSQTEPTQSCRGRGQRKNEESPVELRQHKKVKFSLFKPEGLKPQKAEWAKLIDSGSSWRCSEQPLHPDQRHVERALARHPVDRSDTVSLTASTSPLCHLKRIVELNVYNLGFE